MTDSQKSIFPSNYKITLEPNLETFVFKGQEVITFEIKDSTKEIVLESLNIKVFSCELINNDKNQVLEYKLGKKSLKIQLPEEISQGIFKIKIDFQGELNDKLAGFYRSNYQEDGKEKYIATTQFEAADARQAFPCFDKPSYKATFDVTLLVNKHLTAISNMPVIKEEIKEDRKTVVFDTTPLMSTYLLYFGVGEFEIKEEKYKDILLRGITTKGKSEYTAFAIECAQKSLEYFEEYFQVPYPLPKLDLIGIPDFSSGAMENWGAITFRENAILFYPGKSSLSTTQRVAEVVAHELAHQWFGNLVTMKWWDDLWLNESFATFMAYKVIDTYWPEWDIWSTYVTDTVFEGMALDSLKSSHPIKVKVTDVEEMNELFDEIAYDKGGSVLRMVEKYMTEQLFRNGLRKYIASNQYKNTEAHDLWTALENVAHKPIVTLVEEFITQVGFPLVDVNQGPETSELEQSRFTFGKSNDNSLWSVPLMIEYADNKKESLIFNQKNTKLSSPSSLLTINADYGGFFITHYDKSILKTVGENFTKLNEREKLGTLHDLYKLIRYNKESVNMFLNFLEKYVINEKSSSLLYYLTEELENIYLLTGSDQLKKTLLQFTKKGLEKVGMIPRKEDSTYDIYLRAVVLSVLSELEDREISKFLDEKFNKYLTDPASLHPDLKTVTFSHAVWSDEKNYEKVLKLYRNTDIQEEKVKLLSALVNSKNISRIKESLDFTLSSEVRFGNVYYALGAATENLLAKQIVFDWMLENWDEFKKRVGGHGATMLRHFIQIVIPVCGIGNEDKVNEFMKKNRAAGLEKTFDQAIEELKINSTFVKESLKIS